MMTDLDLIERLESRRIELHEQLASLQLEIGELTESRAGGDTHFEPGYNEGDPIQVELESTRRLQEATKKELADLEIAISRASDGAYGICISCGEAIAPERLEAIPSAVECVSCKSKNGPLQRR